MKRTLEVGFEGSLRSVTVDVPDAEPQPWDAKTELAVVGKKIARVDGPLKVTGKAKYTFDVIVPGMLYAAVLRSPLPAARLKKLDLGNVEGVVINNIEAGSPAANAGLKTGDVIEKVGDAKVTNPDEFKTAIENSKLEDGILLLVHSDGGSKFVVLQ